MKSLEVSIRGIVYGSTSANLPKLSAWKKQIASAVKEARGFSQWAHSDEYTIVLVFSFHPESHWNQQLDVENYVKPVIDATAAGLFCDQDKQPEDISSWNYPDYNFKTLMIRRLPDIKSAEAEGVNILVFPYPLTSYMWELLGTRMAIGPRCDELHSRDGNAGSSTSSMSAPTT